MERTHLYRTQVNFCVQYPLLSCLIVINRGLFEAVKLGLQDWEP